MITPSRTYKGAGFLLNEFKYMLSLATALSEVLQETTNIIENKRYFFIFLIMKYLKKLKLINIKVIPF
jgi:hypothetical protein